MNKLGEDNLVKICTYLDRHEVCRFSVCCKAFVLPSRNNMVWGVYFYDFLSPIREYIESPNDVNDVLLNSFAYPPLYEEEAQLEEKVPPASFRDLYSIWRRTFEGYHHSEISLIHNFWFRMERYLMTHAQDILASLRAPLSEMQMDTILMNVQENALSEMQMDTILTNEDDIPLQIPRVLRLLYRFHDGQNCFLSNTDHTEWFHSPTDGARIVPNVSLFGGYAVNNLVVTNILLPLDLVVMHSNSQSMKTNYHIARPWAHTHMTDEFRSNENRCREDTCNRIHDTSKTASICPFLDFMDGERLNKLITPDGNIFAAAQPEKEGSYFPCVDVDGIRASDKLRLIHIGYPPNVIDSIMTQLVQIKTDMAYNEDSPIAPTYANLYASYALWNVELSLFGNWMVEYVHRLEIGIYDVRSLDIDDPKVHHQDMVNCPLYNIEDGISKSGRDRKSGRTKKEREKEDDKEEEEEYSHARRWKGDMYKAPRSMVDNGHDRRVFINLFPLSIEDLTSSPQGRELYAKYDDVDKALLSKCLTTNGVTISVHQIFVPSYANNFDDEYIWTYSVRMDLHKSHPSRPRPLGVCELVTRHWRFKNPTDMTRSKEKKVDGPGVVGMYPRLTLDDQLYPFTYQSCTSSDKRLHSVMSGHVLMRVPDNLESGSVYADAASSYLGAPLTHLEAAEMSGKFNEGDMRLQIDIPETEFVMPRFIY